MCFTFSVQCVSVECTRLVDGRSTYSSSNLLIELLLSLSRLCLVSRRLFFLLNCLLRVPLMYPSSLLLKSLSLSGLLGGGTGEVGDTLAELRLGLFLLSRLGLNARWLEHVWIWGILLSLDVVVSELADRGSGNDGLRRDIASGSCSIVSWKQHIIKNAQ